MSVTPFFPNLIVGDDEYEFSHLVPFSHTLYGQGGDNATIRVRASFKSHVFSTSPEGDENADFQDENGKDRVFCQDRYNRSKHLPGLCLNAIITNALTWQSEDKNSISSLVVADDPLSTGLKYAVYYYLYPSKHDDYDVELVVKSAYLKEIEAFRIKRRHKLLSLVRKCFFTGTTIP